jgi:DNA repair protein RecO (recombination protein O)
MLVKSQGIVLSFLKYKDTSIIVKIFTRDFGLKSFIINGIRSTKSKNTMAFYQPMTLLDLVIYHKESSSLQRISEVKLSKAFERIPFEFRRSAITLFMTEILSKSIYEGYQNATMFDFIEASLLLLDSPHVNLAHFPTAFLLENSKYLGFAPNSAEEFFEELEQDWMSEQGFPIEADYLNALLINSFSFDETVPSLGRRNLLDMLLSFYSKHLEQNNEWKSIQVLRQLMGES